MGCPRAPCPGAGPGWADLCRPARFRSCGLGWGPRGQNGAVSLSRDCVLGSVVGSVAQGRGAAAGCGDGGAEPGGAGRRLGGLQGPGRAQVAELVGIGRVRRRAGSARGARGWWPVSRHKGLVVRGAGGGEAHGGQARGHGAALATGTLGTLCPGLLGWRGVGGDATVGARRSVTPHVSRMWTAPTSASQTWRPTPKP